MTNNFCNALRGSFAVLGLAALVAGQNAHAATLSNIYNTGVLTNNPSTGAPATFNTPGNVDTHYTVISSSSLPSAPLAGVGAPAYVLDPTVYPGNVYVNNPGSLYISPAPTGSGTANTYYDYRTTFDLTGYVPSTASLTGNYSGDDTLVGLYFNGVNTGTVGNPSGNYSAITPFTFTTQFVTGINTIDFIFYNINQAGTNPTSLAVGGLTLTADVPEPGSVAMLVGMGISGAGFLVRRKRVRKTA